MPDEPPDRPANRDAAQATAQIRAAHLQETSALQSAMDRLTAIVGMPGFVVAMTGVIAMWILGNTAAQWMGFATPDPPPFVGLEAVIPVVGLYISVLILTTQRRQDKFASHRGQLELELAILNDQKVSKIIALLEEARRDNPMISDRRDSVASAMSTPADPHSVLEAIKDIPSDQI